MSETFYRRGLSLVLITTLLAGLTALAWGLPNGNRTWAADSVAPMTPYSVAYHVFAEHGPNSGYFYFKYPVGHQLLLAAVGSPVLAWAALTGNLRSVSTDYPFGMEDPEPVLATLQIAMRLLSVLLSLGLVAAVAGTARRLTSPRAGLFAAVAVLGSYPFLFYQHTTNVELPYLFWAFLALYSVVRASESGASPRWMWLFGLAAAMAVSTKEQIVGFVILIKDIKPVFPHLDQIFGIFSQPDDQGFFDLEKFRRQGVIRNQGNISGADSSICEIETGWCFRGAGNPHKDHVGLIEISNRLSVVMGQDIVHGLESMKIFRIHNMLVSGFFLTLQTEKLAHGGKNRVESRDTRNTKA